MVQLKLMKVAAAVAVGSLAVSACGGVASESTKGDGASVHIRATNLLPPGNAQGEIMEWFLDELEKRTDGEVTGEVTYGGALIAGADTLPGLKQGRAEAGHVIPAYHPADLPLSGVIMVPLPGASQGARVHALADVFDKVDVFREEIEKNDLVLLGFLPNASSTMAVNEPLDNLESLKGRKIRVPSQPQAAVLEELGAEPVFMASEEVYESVERKIVDGVTFPLDVQISNGIAEVAKTLTPDVGQSGGSIFALNKATYEKLSDKAKEVIEELRGEWAAKSDALLTKYEAEACETYLKEGGKIVNWSPVEIERLGKIVDAKAVSVWKSEAAKAGYEDDDLDTVWNAYSTAVADFEDESDYTDIMKTCGQ